MANSCEQCERNCCRDFSITTEITNPVLLGDTLRRFSFIKRTGSKLALVNGKEMVVGVYNCDRFNVETGTCRDYDMQERPNFCKNAGNVNAPQNGCLLFKPENE